MAQGAGTYPRPLVNMGLLVHHVGWSTLVHRSTFDESHDFTPVSNEPIKCEHVSPRA